jgi:hypothetical protein
MAFLFCRCFVPELDGNGSDLTPLFNVSELRQYIPVKADGQVDSCQRYDPLENATIEGCEDGFVFDREYYKESRVIEVSILYQCM